MGTSRMLPSEINQLADSFRDMVSRLGATPNHMKAIEFAYLCLMHRDRAWKSKRTEETSIPVGMFEVGINTPGGTVVNQFQVELYWDLFMVTEIEQAPIHDQPTSSQISERLDTLLGV